MPAKHTDMSLSQKKVSVCCPGVYESVAMPYQSIPSHIEPCCFPLFALHKTRVKLEELATLH